MQVSIKDESIADVSSVLLPLLVHMVGGAFQCLRVMLPNEKGMIIDQTYDDGMPGVAYMSKKR